MSEHQSTVKVKTLDCERSELLHREALKNLDHCQLEREKLMQKTEVLCDYSVLIVHPLTVPPLTAPLKGTLHFDYG